MIDGFEVAFHGEYREMVPNERIVCTEVYEGIPDGGRRVGGEHGDGRGEGWAQYTTLLVDAPSPDVRDAIINSGIEAGMQDAMDLLEDVAVRSCRNARVCRDP